MVRPAGWAWVLMHWASSGEGIQAAVGEEQVLNDLAILGCVALARAGVAPLAGPIRGGSNRVVLQDAGNTSLWSTSQAAGNRPG